MLNPVPWQLAVAPTMDAVFFSNHTGIDPSANITKCDHKRCTTTLCNKGSGEDVNTAALPVISAIVSVACATVALAF